MPGPIDKLEREHHALDHLCWQTYQAVSRNDQVTAILRFEEFATLSESHFRAEEELLFERLAKSNAELRGCIDSMKKEHQQLRRLKQELTLELAHSMDETTLQHCERLLRVLRVHAQKEELLLFNTGRLAWTARDFE